MAREDGYFRPGNSGNPGGKKKIPTEVKELCAQQTIPSIKTLMEIRDNKKAPAACRILAANSILDRGLGKPRQEIEGELTISNISVTIAEKDV